LIPLKTPVSFRWTVPLTIHISMVSMFQQHLLSTHICFNNNFCTWEEEAGFAILCWLYVQREIASLCLRASAFPSLSYYLTQVYHMLTWNNYYFLFIHSHSCHCTTLQCAIEILKHVEIWMHCDQDGSNIFHWKIESWRPCICAAENNGTV
jgi:hypothetical protein